MSGLMVWARRLAKGIAKTPADAAANGRSTEALPRRPVIHVLSIEKYRCVAAVSVG